VEKPARKATRPAPKPKRKRPAPVEINGVG
jgi:hypothetical protein